MNDKQDHQTDQKNHMNNSAISTLNHSRPPTTNNSHRRALTPHGNYLNNSQLFQSNFFQTRNTNTIKQQIKKKNRPAWGISSATLRHNAPRYSFSKDSRFKQYKCSHLDIQQLSIQSTLTNKACTFGKGRRTPISENVIRNAKQKPSPDRYNLKPYLQTTRNSILGKTFGISMNFYQKTYIKHRKDAYCAHYTQDNPPAKYDVRQIPGKNKKKFSIYGRLKMFNEYEADLHRDVPGPVHEIKNELQKNKRGLNERNFGFGERIDLGKPLNEYPGAGTYNIKGFCQINLV